MKSLIINFLSLILCLTFSASLFAQPGTGEDDPDPDDKPPIVRLGTIHNDGDGTDPINHYCLDENNTFSFSTQIILGNLNLYEEDGESYGTVWPSVEPMYVEFEINGVVYPPQEVGVFDAVVLSDGSFIFVYEVQSPTVDFSNQCSAPKEEDVNSVWINAKVRLVTPVGEDEYTIYPACNYVWDVGMFNCDIYSNAPWCQSDYQSSSFDDDGGPTCYNEWYAGIVQGYGHCDCEEIPGPGDFPDKENESIIGNGDDNSKRNSDDFELNVYPNPVQNVLHLESNDNITNVVLYDAKGNMILSNSFLNGGIGKVNLDTSILPKGLYLARVTTTSGLKMIKVLK